MEAGTLLGVLIFVAIVIGVVVALAAVAIASQSRRLYIPRSYESFGLKQHYARLRNSFQSKYGTIVDLSGGSYLIEGTVPRVWITLGGNAMLALDWLPFIARLREEGNNDSFVLVEYPSYGNNVGGEQPGEEVVTATVDNALRQALNQLGSKSASLVEPSIHVLAHSLGCAVGMRFVASGHPEVKSLVLVAPFLSIAEMAASLFVPNMLKSLVTPELLKVAIFEQNRWDNVAALRMIEARSQSPPVISIIHGTHDAIIPFSHSTRLREACSARVHATLRPIPGGDHNSLFETAGGEIVEEMTKSLAVR